MSNQTVKNMELVLLEIRKEVFNNYGDSKAVKTLIHSYQTMLSTFSTLGIKEYKESNVASDLNKQKIDLTYIKDYVEDAVIQQLVIKKDYVAVNNYSTVIEKFSRCIDTITRYNDGYREETRKRGYVNPIIEELLDLSVKSGTLITFKDEVYRGMGKTTALIKKAGELGCVLVCATRHQANYARMQATELGLDVTIISPPESTLIQYKHIMKEKGYLADELVDKDKLSYLNKEGCKLLGGFVRVAI